MVEEDMIYVNSDFRIYCDVEIAMSGTETAKIRYKKSGDNDWTEVDAFIDAANSYVYYDMPASENNTAGYMSVQPVVVQDGKTYYGKMAELYIFELGSIEPDE